MSGPARPDAPAPDPCIFCRIVRRELPAEVVAHSDRALAFLTIGPVAEGHTLVIPKRHAADLTEVAAVDSQALFVLVHDVEQRLRRSGLAEGVDLLCLSGRAAEQGVFHLHVHVIPRRTGDRLEINRWFESKLRSTTPHRQAELGRQIRSAGAPV